MQQADTMSPKLFTAVPRSLVWDKKGADLDGGLLSNLRLGNDIILFLNSTAEAQVVT